MDFSLTEEQKMFQGLFAEFTQNEVAPLADRIDREERPPLETLDKAAGMELMGLPFPPEYGGAGIGMLGQCLFLEETGKHCLSTAVTLAAHTGQAAMSISLGGTAEQKQKYLPLLAKGQKIAAFALTELEAGSDISAIRTKAVWDGDHYLLGGEKGYVMNGDIADVFVVYARTGQEISALIVEKGVDGLKVGKREPKMGIRGASTNLLTFDRCPVPVDNLLGGEEGKGLANALTTMDYARVQIGAMGLGTAEGALEASLRFAVTREQFGGPIAQKQAIQMYLADMATEIEALRTLVYRAAWALDQGQSASQLAAMCKLYGSEVAERVVNKAVQIHGGAGYVRDFPLERVYRDVRVLRILDGPSETQRLNIASALLKERGVQVKP